MQINLIPTKPGETEWGRLEDELEKIKWKEKMRSESSFGFCLDLILTD